MALVTVSNSEEEKARFLTRYIPVWQNIHNCHSFLPIEICYTF